MYHYVYSTEKALFNFSKDKACKLLENLNDMFSPTLEIDCGLWKHHCIKFVVNVFRL